MGVRTRIGDGLARVAKTFGTSVPESFRQGEAASQMTSASPFSPGGPIGPYDGYDRQPRALNYVTGYNIATRPRTHEAVSFGTLQGLFQSYDVASICLWHRIDSIRSLDWKLLPAEHYHGDVTGAVPLGLAALRRPDRRNSFKTWLAKYLYDVLAYDAGTLYRLRNRAGRAVGLSVVDGTTVAPLLDYWGNSPEPPAEAYVQYVNGLPWNWLTRDDLIYEPFRPRPDSPYGHAPLESILLNANCYSDDTEVLTDRGWLRFAEVDISSDKFATRNPATAAFEWQSATRYYEADSDGTMYRAASRNVDLLVTGGHRLLVDRLPKGCPGVRHGSEWLVHAADLYEYQAGLPGGGARVCCPATSTWNAPDLECFTLPVSPGDFVRMDGEAVREARASAGFPACSLGIAHRTLRRAERGDRLRRASAETICDAYGLPCSVIQEDPHYFSESIEGDDFAAFMGMYLSEGCVKPDGPNITIAQEEYSKGYVEYRDLLTRMLGREAPYHRGAFTFGHTALADYLRSFGKAHEKYIPREVLGMSRRQLEIFWHFYVLGDGAIYPHTTIVTTCSKRLADGLQEILQKIGYSTAVRPVGKPAKPTHHQRWQIQTRRKPAYRINVERVPYEGKVYCVSVPSKTLYVRRNGYPAWCANTDLRFQVYFLQRFSEGNLPAAFASSPDTWSPDQIEQFQTYWDSFMYGDQSRKHQVRWMPGGSKLMWSNEKDFSDTFSLFLMRKTAAAFHVVPSDIGFTENVNRSSGESQADVQHRVGDLPLMEHVEGILSAFLEDDLGLPLRFEFDRGEEQVDQAAQAEADQRYMDRAVVSPSEIREMRYGLTDTTPVPRSFFTTRAGPIPLSSLMSVSGEVDPVTAAPEPGAVLPREAFGGTPGVIPEPPLKVPSLAEQEFGESAMPPAPPPQPKMPPGGDMPAPVAKEGDAGSAPAAGITSGTGLYSYDLDRDDEPDEAEVAKELASFRRFEKTRRRSGAWRDFTFAAVDAVTAHNLNDGGRLAVRKAAGEVAVAGLAVRAADTGRVLMLQRALCDDDPAAGTWEFPGGHLEDGESPLAAAWREWQEETGSACAPGAQTGTWTSGIYQGIVWTIEREAMVPVRSEAVIANPDDPDGDQVEAVAWWSPEQMRDNSAIRPELAASLDAVMAALGIRPAEGAESVCPCGVPVVYDEMNGWQHADGSISHDDGESVSDKMGGKVSPASVSYRAAEDPARCCGTCSMIRPDGDGYACTLVEGPIDPGAVCDEWDPAETAVAKADGLPKGPGLPKAEWPGWQYDLKAAEHWAPKVTAAVLAVLPDSRLRQLARDYLASHPGDGGDAGKRDLNDEATAWLREDAPDLSAALLALIAGILADAYLIGAASASAITDRTRVSMGTWEEPGDTSGAEERIAELGVGDGYDQAQRQQQDRAEQIAGGFLAAMGRTLADGLQDEADAGSLADSLKQAVSDHGLAAGLVLTVVTGISALAAMAWYALRKVQYGTWIGVLDSRICPTCLSNVGARVKIGDPYPSGDTAPPIHPGDRCAVVPA